MPKVIYKNNDAFVKISKSDRAVAKKVNVKLGRKDIVTVDKYASLLEKISKKRRKR